MSNFAKVEKRNRKKKNKSKGNKDLVVKKGTSKRTKAEKIPKDEVSDEDDDPFAESKKKWVPTGTTLTKNIFVRNKLAFFHTKVMS